MNFKTIPQCFTELYTEYHRKPNKEINQITHEILDSAYKVHSTLGSGLLVSAYQACLVYELRKKGLKVEFEKPLPLIYEQ
jgi:hypothetical protein